MKQAVCLCGGGAKGAYECGVWDVLQSRNFSYQIVTGTSIGALNGAMMAMHAYEACSHLWDTITADQVTSTGFEFEARIDAILRQRSKLPAFFKSYINEKGADITPFKELMARTVDIRAFLDSPVEFGLVTVQFPSLRPVEMQKSEMDETHVLPYLLASASCFPAFPICKIDDKSYVDGCYFDNLPIPLAIKMGAEEILAVDLNPDEPTHPQYENKPFVTLIRPYWPLGPGLFFARETIDRNRALGRLDAQKTFGLARGFRYAFAPHISAQEQALAQQYLHLITQIEAQIPMLNSVLGHTIGREAGLTHHLLLYTRGRRMTYDDYYVRGAELCAEALGIDPAVRYDLPALVQQMQQRYTQLVPHALFSSGHMLSTVLHSHLDMLDSAHLIGAIWCELRSCEDLFAHIRTFAALSPQALAAALFLYVHPFQPPESLSDTAPTVALS